VTVTRGKQGRKFSGLPRLTVGLLWAMVARMAYPQHMMTSKDAASYLGVTYNTIKAWRRTGVGAGFLSLFVALYPL